jgi:hypothetical protein
LLPLLRVLGRSYIYEIIINEAPIDRGCGMHRGYDGGRHKIDGSEPATPMRLLARNGAAA